MNTATSAVDVSPSTNAAYAIAPKIGELLDYEGGIYAGVVRGDPGQPDYRLIVCATDGPKGPWKEAGTWAAGLEADGHKDFTLPKRKEQAVMFGNVPELFEKNWYWSSEQYAGYDDYAWVQGFLYGYQLTTHKDDHCRARAVRRVPI